MTAFKVNGVNRVLNVYPVEKTAKERVLRFYQHRQFFLKRHIEDGLVKKEIDWRPKTYLVPDQLTTGLCTGFAGATAIQYLTLKRPSETALYVFASMIDPWADTLPFCSGGGSNGKSILETAKNTGLVPIRDWNFTDTPQFYKGDGDTLLAIASQWKIRDYVNLDVNEMAVRKWLSQKSPILLGANVDLNYLMANKTGIVNSYDPGQVKGGHELVIGGYKDDRYFLDGSWGENHGANGRCFYRWSELKQMTLDLYGIVI